MNARSLALCSTIMLAAVTATAQAAPAVPTDTAYFNAVNAYLTASGARTNMRIVFDKMIDQFRQSFPQVPAQAWEEFHKSFDPDSLIAMEIPIYKKYLSLDDLRAITAFYTSPTGKKLVSVTPNILQESMEVGRVWGQQVGRRIMEKLKAQGYIKSS